MCAASQPSSMRRSTQFYTQGTGHVLAPASPCRIIPPFRFEKLQLIPERPVSWTDILEASS